MEPSARTLELLGQLIAFDTTSRNSNLALIDFTRDLLDQHGIQSELVHNEDRTKANLYATLGPCDRPGIALSGHTDVVPVDGQDWASEPFRLQRRDDALYGRGTADMKGFIAVCLSLVPEYLARPRSTPVHLVLSYDEEVGCLGVRGLLEKLAQRPVKPKACIVGEPTGMQIVRGHKGKLSMRCKVRGKEAHSSLADQGVNAVEAAAEAVAFLKRLAREQRDRGPRDAAYAPAYTTVHTGVIQGGTALNIVPAACEFVFEFRHLPEVDPQDLLERLRRHVEHDIAPEMHAVDPATGFEFEPISRIPGFDTDENSEIVQLVKSITGQNSTGKVAFGTEAGLFETQAGIPTVICGPGYIDQAHKPDEFVALEQIARCEQFIRSLFERCS